MPQEAIEEFESPILGEDEAEEPAQPEDEGKSQEPEVSIETIATEMGWKPKSDFQGHEDDYVDAATYIRRSKDIQETMRQHLKENKKKLTSLEKGIEDLRQHNDRVYKVQLEQQRKQIDQLKKERREAIEDGDVARVEALDEQMTKLSETPKNEEPQIDPEQYSVFSEWLKSNSWYNLDGITEGNPDLTEYADNLSKMPDYQAMLYHQRLKKVAAKVKEMFPEHFKENSKPAPKAAPNPVEAPHLKSAQKKFTARDLSDDQKSIMRNFVRNGIMSEQEYIDDLVKIGELG